MKESGLMFMRNINNLKRNARKIVAAMLSVVTAVTLMPVQAVQGKGTYIWLRVWLISIR